MSAKRVRLSPTYLTADERDLIRSALAALVLQLDPQVEGGSPSTRFARSFTKRRIEAVIALFHEKATGAAT